MTNPKNSQIKKCQRPKSLTLELKTTKTKTFLKVAQELKLLQKVDTRGVKWAGPHFEPFSGFFLEGFIKGRAKNELYYN